LAFFTIIAIRFQRDAEIRALTGGYLSDGTEVASFKMPELFATATPGQTLMAIYKESEQPTEAAVDPRHSFFASFPEYFSQMRDALQELGRTTDNAQQTKILGDMAELIDAYKVEANIWQLRPIMQVSTVLELLLRRLADKPKDISPSALRTIAGALDLLGDLAVPDLRADLLMMPPLKILAVDDEPLCLRALTFALTKANLTPDLAHDGQEAVSLAKANAYDVVFMDINMPVMDGFTACTQVRETTLNTNTPVVFVTVQSDFQTRAKSNLIGGRDFMAKPFLIFELTVKAITYAARKRLKPIASNSRSQVIQDLLGTTPALATPKAPAAADVAAKTIKAVASV
jgi:CheY-like chemotaxis protein